MLSPASPQGYRPLDSQHLGYSLAQMPTHAYEPDSPQNQVSSCLRLMTTHVCTEPHIQTQASHTYPDVYIPTSQAYTPQACNQTQATHSWTHTQPAHDKRPPGDTHNQARRVQ